MNDSDDDGEYKIQPSAVNYLFYTVCTQWLKYQIPSCFSFRTDIFVYYILTFKRRKLIVVDFAAKC